MFCNNCGSHIDDTDKFCGTCGAPNTRAVANDDPFAQPPGVNPPPQNNPWQQQGAYRPQPQQQNSFSQQGSNDSQNTYALVGFILAFFIPILGLIFSIMGLREANRLNGDRKGFAIAGIVISVVWMVIAFISVIIVTSIVSAAVSSYPYYYYYSALALI